MKSESAPPRPSPSPAATARLRTTGVVSVFVAIAVVGAMALNATVGLPGLPGVGSGTDSASLGPQVPVTATETNSAQANNSPMVVADPGDTEFLALANRLDAPDYACSLHVSGDGGRLWTPVAPVPELPEGAEKCYGPEVAIDTVGTIYYSFIGLQGAGNLPVGVYLTTSTDRGRTFSPPRQVLEGFNFGVRMAIDPSEGALGRLHLVWLQAGTDPVLGGMPSSDNPILTAYSDDGGQTFSEPVRVNDPDRVRVVAPSLALGGDGNVYVGYYDLGEDARDYQGLEGPVWDGAWQLVVASSADGGESFGSGVVADAEVAPYERVLVIFTHPPASLAAHGDQVCTSWGDGRLGDADVFARCSVDGAVTWSPAVRVNGDPEASGRWQYLPQLDLSPSGRLDVAFLDRQSDPENLRNDVTYTSSVDGGATFARPITLNTTGSSFTQIGQQYAIPTGGDDRFDFGFRIALLARDDEVFVAWTDTHLAATNRSQDIFATIVEPPMPESGVLTTVLVSVLAVVAGGLVLAATRRRGLARGEEVREENSAEVAPEADLTEDIGADPNATGDQSEGNPPKTTSRPTGARDADA